MPKERPPKNDKIEPLPTLVKTRIGITDLRKQIGPVFKEIEGREIVCVSQHGSESKAIVREQYLMELINICNALMYDRLQIEAEEPFGEDDRERLLEMGKASIRRSQQSED